MPEIYKLLIFILCVILQLHKHKILIVYPPIVY
ncbi:metal/formaldehyde-sensitive transcriptional repressor, partial [Salmonella enterica subsp. enterica serovar Infantis]|nr:metal/formaldehyde-sensitive transcriptional repressor [Salmonella enterica subsp. enterica serovar Infantis]